MGVDGSKCNAPLLLFHLIKSPSLSLNSRPEQGSVERNLCVCGMRVRGMRVRGMRVRGTRVQDACTGDVCERGVYKGSCARGMCVKARGSPTTGIPYYMDPSLPKATSVRISRVFHVRSRGGDTE